MTIRKCGIVKSEQWQISLSGTPKTKTSHVTTHFVAGHRQTQDTKRSNINQPKQYTARRQHTIYANSLRNCNRIISESEKRNHDR